MNIQEGLSMKFKIFILAVLMFGYTYINCSNSVEPKLDDSYERVESELSVDKTRLFYTLDIPKSYKAAKDPTPLFLVLHWGGTGGQVNSTFGKDILKYLIKSAYKDVNAFFVAPINPMGSSWVNAKSETLVKALLDTLMQNYNIDKNRVVVTGYSQGAIGTWYFAMRFRGMFSGAIPISGTPELHIATSIKDVPLYVIHSRNDELFPFTDEEKLVNSLKTQGIEIEFKIVEGITHNDVQSFVKPLSESILWLNKIWQQ